MNTCSKERILPVILAGGEGTRLWPLSRKGRPKQFLALLEGENGTLFQQTVKRVLDASWRAPLVLGNEEHRFLIAEQLREIESTGHRIVLEPLPRNTAPAALVAALLADPSDLLLLLPSDHYIENAEAFTRSMEQGAEAAEEGNIVTFGVPPTRPETGYGYIEVEEAAGLKGNGARPVRRFVEKPDREKAEEYLASGRHFWNSGVFLVKAEVLLEAFRTHAPELLPPCRDAVEGGREDMDFFRLDSEAYARSPSISIDYAVMERADNIVNVPLSAGWSDLGSWHAIWERSGHDENGNAIIGDVLAEDVRNSLIMQSDGPCVAVSGLEDVIVAATQDAVLVIDRKNSQNVRRIVDHFRRNGRPEAEQHIRVYRPWGWYQQLASGERYQVKSLMVSPGAQLSLQSHYHRAEHWVVVSGTVLVTLEDEEFILTENQSAFIPIGKKHRLANPGKVPAMLIEVQSGAYLGEDDIVRHEDIYGRIEPGTKDDT